MESHILSAFGYILDKSLPVLPRAIPATSPNDGLRSLLFVITEELDLIRELNDEMNEECVYMHIKNDEFITFYQGKRFINGIHIDERTKISITTNIGKLAHYNKHIQVLMDKLGITHSVSLITLYHKQNPMLILYIDLNYGMVMDTETSQYRVSGNKAVKFLIEIIDKCPICITSNTEDVL